MRTTLALLLATTLAPQGDDWALLFDGKTIAGWKNPYEWGDVKVVEGEIHLTAEKKFFLCTEKEYKNFIFEGEVMVPAGRSNSGFMFRCHVEKNKVFGYQAEVDPSDRKWSGGLYDEGRRGWLNPMKGDKSSEVKFREKAGDCFKAGQWNRYRMQCEGDRLQIWVNDVQTTDHRDAVDAQGFLAIQHHGEKGQTYRFRNLRVKPLK